MNPGIGNRSRRCLLQIVMMLVCFAPQICAASTFSPNPRKPEVAGTFYPADPVVLRATVDSAVMRAARLQPRYGASVAAIIAPHAGYEFSGGIAGYSYAQLIGRRYKTVLILGPSHKASYAGYAIHPAAQWETPLGTSDVDTALASELLASGSIVQINAEAFDKEHSIEDQLPFVQRVFGLKTKILPIACGSMNAGTMRMMAILLESWSKRYEDSILIIASSDMSHYKTYSETRARDSIAATDVVQLDIDQLAKDLESERCEFCGYVPVLTTLFLAEHRLWQPRFLYYANSGDVTKDTTRDVGYGAFSFTRSSGVAALGPRQQTELLRMARASIDTFVRTGEKARFAILDSLLLTSSGAFVTLTEHQELRGCIGHIVTNQTLGATVCDAAIAACSNDSRFSPVTQSELKEIALEISVLGPLKRIRDTTEISMGIHGLYLQIGAKSGIFLPQVPKQFGWTKLDYLENLGGKAGLSKDAWMQPGAQLYTFTAQVFSEK